MLKTINLTKIYKPKKGVPVKALDNVSLTFPEKGMVFLLGKSGSGKSTLLNVLGGLDRYNSGEILIQGKSTRHFKQSHFDSYRNTYVGFIFQEYNILDEFSVGANIALALQLQGQKPTSEQINAILHEVDLDGYGNRKPNELSGGQKQRVAIARALVKNPKIIMADEPTGALDSTTGRQVLNTLKKLSTDKLVIVVSHDREFAEQYADRIIELSDGRVIRDVERITDDTVLDNPVPVYMEDSVTIPEQYTLTQQDMDAICTYIQKMVNKGKSPQISLAGNERSFQPTDTDRIAVSQEGYKLIKSRLPLKYAFKLGASGLKHKKFRLVMTILLSCTALVLFGLADTIAAYSYSKTAYSSLTDPESNVFYAAFEKNQQDKTHYGMTPLSQDDLELIEDRTDLDLYPVYSADNLHHLLDDYYNDAYHMQRFGGIIEINEDILDELDAKLIAGTYPTKYNEVAISTSALETYKEYGFIQSSNLDMNTGEFVLNKTEIDEAEDLLGLTLNGPNEVTYTICGVVDTGLKTDRYEPLKNPDEDATFTEQIALMALQMELNYARNYSLAGQLMVGPAFLKHYAAMEPNFTAMVNLHDNDYKLRTTGGISAFNPDAEITWLDGQPREKLGDNEIIVNASNFYDCSPDMVPYYEQGNLEALLGAPFTVKITEATDNPFGNGQYYNELYKNLEGQYDLKLVGIVENAPTMLPDRCLPSESPIIQTLSPMPKSPQQIRKLIDLSDQDFNPDEEYTLYYNLMNPVSFELRQLDGTLKIMGKVFFYIGLAFVIFASLLFSNFIAVSISYKKEQIGILRAIGSRGNDVFRIFFAEGFCIAMINFVLSFAGTLLLSLLINTLIKSGTGLLLTILNVGIRQVVLIFGVCLLSAFVACYLPVHKIAAKRPIDAIRDR